MDRIRDFLNKWLNKYVLVSDPTWRAIMGILGVSVALILNAYMLVHGQTSEEYFLNRFPSILRRLIRMFAGLAVSLVFFTIASSICNLILKFRARKRQGTPKPPDEDSAHLH
jgi:hypothetical protein